MKTCKTCTLWETNDDTPYCVLKPLYTHTEPNHECDEFTHKGNLYYIPIDLCTTT